METFISADYFEPLTINSLTTPAFCPTSKQPELKHTAVKILRAELPWSLLGMAWLPEEQALAARTALRRHMSRFAFATCVPFGREPSERGVTGVLFRASDYEAPTADVIQSIEALLGLGGPGVLRYADARKGQRRAMRVTLEHQPPGAPHQVERRRAVRGVPPLKRGPGRAVEGTGQPEELRCAAPTAMGVGVVEGLPGGADKRQREVAGLAEAFYFR